MDYLLGKFQMNVPELPPFLLEPLAVDREREEFMKAMAGKSISEFDGQVSHHLMSSLKLSLFHVELGG